MSASPFYSPHKLKPANPQTGFTLLEVMVALVIFAMLALAGWQVFASLNKAKERAQLHAEALSDLQYAYLQLQNDLKQVTAWQTTQLSQSSSTSDKNQPSNQQQSGQNNQPNTNASDSNSDTDTDNEQVSYRTPAFFVLESQSISFIRFADPDPRYQTSPTFSRVSYSVQGDSLVRQQFFSLEKDSKSIDSVLLSGVQQLNWQALLPEPADSFSSLENQTQQTGSTNPTTTTSKQTASKANATTPAPMLPKGVSFSFVYQENPIEWLFALPNEAPALSSNYQPANHQSTSQQSTNNQPTNNQPSPNPPTDSSPEQGQP